MARFYADIQGNRGAATRMGTKDSGMNGHIRGWYLGCRVMMRYNKQTKEDECTIELTGGSGSGGRPKQLGTFTVKDVQ